MGEASVTLLLRAWAQGDREALDRLTPIVYGELRRLAGVCLRRERPGHTLNPTELVSEAFLRLAAGQHPAYEDRVQFFAVAARHMRRILVDHARRRAADKRGGCDRPVTFDEGLVSGERPEELVALDDALEALATFDQRKARVVEMRFFAGLSVQEIAAVLEVSDDTVTRDWNFAKTWLLRELSRK